MVVYYARKIDNGLTFGNLYPIFQHWTISWYWWYNTSGTKNNDLSYSLAIVTSFLISRHVHNIIIHDRSLKIDVPFSLYWKHAPRYNLFLRHHCLLSLTCFLIIVILCAKRTINKFTDLLGKKKSNVIIFLIVFISDFRFSDNIVMFFFYQKKLTNKNNILQKLKLQCFVSRVQ